tara:strand:- start:7467 stop:8096 length:630 start_codon:yes stop_codon:yes gene_type:complete
VSLKEYRVSAQTLLHILTNFGDQGLILPFVLSVGAMLWFSQARREAIIWIFATGAALATMLLLKLMFLPCGHLLPQWHLRSPSGHAASAFIAYGGFAVLEAKLRTARWQRVAILGAGFLFACMIAGSRLALHVHSLPEVLLGSLVGLGTPLILLWKIRPQFRRTLARPLLLAPLVPLALLIALRGETLHVEGHIAAIAVRLAAALGICA